MCPGVSVPLTRCQVSGLSQCSLPGAAQQGGGDRTVLYKQPWLHCQPKPQGAIVLTHWGGPTAKSRLPEPTEHSGPHHPRPEPHAAPAHSMCPKDITAFPQTRLSDRDKATQRPKLHQTWMEQVQEMPGISPTAAGFIHTRCSAMALLPTQMPAVMCSRCNLRHF